MPNRVLPLTLATSALLAALLLAAAGGGIAVADPGEASDPDTISGPPTGSQSPPPTSPTPTAIAEVPNSLAGALRDLLHRPLSVVGNGRVPGEPPKPDVTNPNGRVPVRQRAHERPAARRDPANPKPKVEPVVVPVPKWSSSLEVLLPLAQRVSIPLPSVPGHENTRLIIDLTDPHRAVSSLQETTKTINALLSDALAPYDPYRTPAPEPQPTFKLLEEEPVVDADGGDATPLAQSSAGLPVLQAPVLVPPIQVAPVRPAAENTSAPNTSAGAGRQVTGTSAGGGRGPVMRGSVTPTESAQTGSRSEVQAPANGSTFAIDKPALRQGYQQYLRFARAGRVAAIAVPGLVGLLGITASGVVTGYRQANSQRYLRVDAARFLP